jgi:hypothetical protein
MIDWKDVLIRSIKTFVETAFAFLLAELAGVDVVAADKEMWIGIALSAGAAGISAVWNGVIEPALKLPSKAEG